MHRVPIVLCVLAFLSAGLLGYLRIQSEKARVALDAQLAAETIRASQLAATLATTREHNVALKTQAGGLESDLVAAKAKLAAAEARGAVTDRELAQARSALDLHEKNARALAAEIATLRQELGDVRAAETSPAAVAAYKTTIADLERQLATTARGGMATGAAGAATAVFTNRRSVASVLSVGPENAFVVLNFGADRGAQAGQRLAITQGTESVATVLIGEVRPGFSIGHVVPESLRGVLQKGDPALLLP